MMIYIGTTGNNGSAIYFDIHAVERRGRGLLICGTLGDGCYEGEVLVEMGRSESITFADAWLGGAGFREFLARCDVPTMEGELLDAVRDLPLFLPRRYQPHGNSGLHKGGSIAETPSVWRAGA